MTKQRELVLRIIRNSKDHLTAEQIFFAAKSEMPSIVLATVYNNLKALCDAGEIRRITLDGAADRYDKSYTLHEHMVCDKCGKITDIDVPGLNKMLEGTVESPIEYYELIVHRNCKDCK